MKNFKSLEKKINYNKKNNFIARRNKMIEKQINLLLYQSFS